MNVKRKVRVNGKEWNLGNEYFHVVRKLPVTVSAIQINEPFEVDTLEGTYQGSPGDWLIRGVEDELYPCKDHTFRKTYEILHMAEAVREFMKRKIQEAWDSEVEE